MWIYNYSSCLMHHGVKGQRWGIRRYQNEDGSLIDKGKTRKEISSDEKTKRSLNKKSTKELSNDELRTLNNRLQLENSRNDLSSRNLSTGKRFVSSVLTGTTIILASRYTAKYLEIGAKSLEKIIGNKIKRA